MTKLKSAEAQSTREGKIFAYIYTLEDQHFELQTEAFDKFEGRSLLIYLSEFFVLN